MSAFTPVTFEGRAPAEWLLLEEAELRDEIRAAGFRVESSFTYALPWDRRQVCCGIIAECRP